MSNDATTLILWRHARAQIEPEKVIDQILYVPRTLLRNEKRHAAVSDPTNMLEHRFQSRLGQPCRRFIQQQKSRPRHGGRGNREQLLLASTERYRFCVSELRQDRKPFEE